MSILAEPAAPRTVDLSGLNSQQRKAVCHDRGPLLVIAGAGSGKTRVLTTRIAHLVTERGVDPASVLAITFTNKAAREMKERLKTMLGAATLGQMRVATFHSAFLRVLRRYPEAVGLRDGFTIFDTDDCTKLVENVTEDVGYDPKTVKPRGTLGAISAAKNALISPAAPSGPSGRGVSVTSSPSPRTGLPHSKTSRWLIPGECCRTAPRSGGSPVGPCRLSVAIYRITGRIRPPR